MNTALVIVDMQRAFCDPQGSFQRRGYVIENIKDVIGQCVHLRRLADTAGWPVVFTRLIYSADYQEAGLLVENNPQIRRLGAYTKDNPESVIVDDIAPKTGDLIVDKHRYDPFMGTDLEKRLLGKKVRQIVVCGVVTNVCVESTVRGAFDRDIRVIVAEDATASYSMELHRASMETMSRHFASIFLVSEIERTFSSAQKYPKI